MSAEHLAALIIIGVACAWVGVSVLHVLLAILTAWADGYSGWKSDFKRLPEVHEPPLGQKLQIDCPRCGRPELYVFFQTVHCRHCGFREVQPARHAVPSEHGTQAQATEKAQGKDQRPARYLRT